MTVGLGTSKASCPAPDKRDSRQSGEVVPHIPKNRLSGLSASPRSGGSTL
jgi:hypothetical protein